MLEIEYADLKPAAISRTPDMSPDGSSNDGIFDFASPATIQKPIANEVQMFLSEPRCSLASLAKFPTVREIFIKYNTPVPSSGTLERAFCTAGRVLTKQRGRLSSKNFQSLMLLKFAQKNM